MNFGNALTPLRAGRFLARSNNPNWDERTYIYLNGDIFIYVSRGYEYTWVPAHPDLLADDWEEVIPTP